MSSKQKTTNDAPDLDMDKFYAVADYPDYKINRRGKILGKFGRPMKHQENEKGYFYVNLVNENGSKAHKVHRLVATQFLLKGGQGKNLVSHVNGDKSNNSVRNLEWVTKFELRARSTKERIKLSQTQRDQIVKTLKKDFKTLTRRDVYDRLVKKYGVSRDYLSHLDYCK